MHAPTLIIAVEIYAVLLIAAVILFMQTRKLKSLLKRQQEKLLTLLNERQHKQKIESKLSIKPAQSYKSYLHEALDATSKQYSQISPSGSIGSEQNQNDPLPQRILALRYAFLRAEELGTTELIGSTEYWKNFEQALGPLLTATNINYEELKQELKISKNRIENLEKYKLLLFDIEKEWTNAQANAENYYEQLTSMSNEFSEKQDFGEILQQYHRVYDDIYKSVIETTRNPDSITKTIINVTRHDQRAAEEIFKLRNIAAEQHRTINQLQQKLIEATTPIEKEVIFQELQQQLQRQVRFVQESETCIQLLEDELSKAHEELSLQGAMLGEQSAINEENQLMKDVLHKYSLESKELISKITILEKENTALKQNKSELNV